MTISTSVPTGPSPENEIEPGNTSALLADVDEGVVLAALDLLAHWWSRPVDEEVMAWVNARELEVEVGRRMSSSTKRPSLVAGESSDLLEEYERLFIGPGPVACPPYESYWRDDVSVDIRRSLMGPCTADLQRLYKELGLEVAPGTGELPDHVAIEFEALAYALAFEETQTIVTSLFSDHLKKWLPRLCRAVAHEAVHPFYRDLAEVTQAWLATMRAYFDSTVVSDLTTG